MDGYPCLDAEGGRQRSASRSLHAICRAIRRVLLLGAELTSRYVRPLTIDDRQALDGETDECANDGHWSAHGSAAGAESAGLRVADPNPRAQAFYRKHGFRPDGARRHDRDLDIDEIRMVRYVA